MQQPNLFKVCNFWYVSILRLRTVDIDSIHSSDFLSAWVNHDGESVSPWQ